MPLTNLIAFLRDQAMLAAGVVIAVLGAAFLLARGLRTWRSKRLAVSEAAPLLIPVQRRGTTRPSRVPVHVDSEGPASSAAGGYDFSAPFPPPGAGGHAGIPDSYLPPRRNGNGNGSGESQDMVADALGNLLADTAMPGRPGAAASKVVHTIPPMDGTLQFLPGRLEVIEGAGPGRDIRFVRTWGEIPEITFGRVAGPPYRHIQLRSQTVSRQHARMQFVDGRWKLTNMSQTNPVIINGDSLDPAHGNRVLRDGDQIEMGEVVFRFRER